MYFQILCHMRRRPLFTSLLKKTKKNFFLRSKTHCNHMPHYFQIMKPKKFRSRAYPFDCFCYLSFLFVPPLSPVCSHHVRKRWCRGPLILWTLVLSLQKWPFLVSHLLPFQHFPTPLSPTIDTHSALLQTLACQNPEVPKMSAGREDSLRNNRDLKEIINRRSVAVRNRLT